jgi:hypothetical protein
MKRHAHKILLLFSLAFFALTFPVSAQSPVPTPAPTATPTPKPWPIVDPRLSPYIENALARLQKCSPMAYDAVKENTQRYVWIEGDTSHSRWPNIEIGEAWIRHTELSDDAGEFYLMLNIAHESRHNWQDNHSLSGRFPLYDFVEPVHSERDAYAFELSVLGDCASTVKNPAEIEWIRGILLDRIANPPTASDR